MSNAFLSPAQAADVARRGRRLLQAGQITHHTYALLDALLWRCRGQGRGIACASYRALAKLTHMAKDTIWRGLEALERLGLISRTRTRIRVSWGSSVASRQGTNLYRLLPPSALYTESAERKPLQREIKIEAQEVKETREALAALARARAVMERRMLGKGCRVQPAV